MNPFEKASFEVFCADMWQEINRNAEVDVNLMSDEDDQDDDKVQKFLRIAEVMWDQPKYATKRKEAEDANERRDQVYYWIQKNEYDTPDTVGACIDGTCECHKHYDVVGTQTVVSIDRARFEVIAEELEDGSRR